MRFVTEHLKFWIVSIVVLVGGTLAIPFLLAQYIHIADSRTPEPKVEQFPVTVDPANETITENEMVNAYIQSQNFDVQALTLSSTQKFGEILLRLAVSISKLLESNNLALVSSEKFVTITAGLRKEEVANAFAQALRWNEKEKREFISPRDAFSLPLAEGSFFPGVYAVGSGAKPLYVQDLMNKRFINNVLSRYGTSTAEIVPLNTALTIASLIERETIGTDDMRIISGIIWNRIFADMNLQLDATLQYARSSNKKTAVWWPEVRTQDKYIRSPYNTYMHGGLPPTPIANPSVAAIIAALNPLKTECIFYFHDKKGDLHCTPTYKEHVALLKKYYGRGK